MCLVEFEYSKLVVPGFKCYSCKVYLTELFLVRAHESIEFLNDYNNVYDTEILNKHHQVHLDANIKVQEQTKVGKCSKKIFCKFKCLFILKLLQTDRITNYLILLVRNKWMLNENAFLIIIESISALNV